MSFSKYTKVCSGCSALVLSSAYFRQASKPQEPSLIEKLNQEFERMDDDSLKAYIFHDVVAASAGKSYFNIADGPDEDCVRTANAIVQSTAKPSVTIRTLDVMERSCAKAATDKSKARFHDRACTACRNINEEVKNWPSDFPDFEQLKRNVQLPKPATNYVYEIPSDQNLVDWMQSVPLNHDDPQMLKFYIVIQFQVLTIPATSDKYRLEIVGTARAVERLSKNVTFQSTVDDVFTEAIEDYVNDIFTQNIDRFAAARGPEFAKKVDQYFLNNSVLKDEYQKIKKQIIDELRNSSPDE